jgi:phage regulator Rha-like protein
MHNPIAAGTITMSSREIAALVQSKHSDVKRSAERLSATGIFSAPLAHTPWISEQNGLTYYEYHFNKRDSLVLVARLSPEFTAAVVDRWQELEKQITVPQSLPEALLIWQRKSKNLKASFPLRRPKRNSWTGMSLPAALWGSAR